MSKEQNVHSGSVQPALQQADCCVQCIHAENLEFMSSKPSNIIDLIYCDVLYGTGKNFGEYKDLKPIRDDIESHYMPRIKEMYRLLKNTGSIYIHCDWNISHWIRCVMDDIFGYSNFKNEIIWSYKRYTAASNRFQRLHDVIFFYSKTPDCIFYEPRDEYGEKSGKADSHYKQDENGDWYRWQKRKGQEPYKVMLNPEGRRLGDVWEIPIINASAKERLGYPTQKPEELLERIITASSKVGDLVADFYLGSGTTAVVSKKLNRNFIGCDTNKKAINISLGRLNN